MAALGLGVLLISYLYYRLPASFLPNEDQGVMYAIVQLPPGSSLGRTRAVLDTVEHYLMTEEKDAVESTVTIAGMSFNGAGHNMGQVIASLRHWGERDRPGLQADDIFARANRKLSTIPDAREALI